MVKFTRDIARKMLGDVPAENSFWCHGGRTLKNLSELESGIKEMTDETFAYHANAEKNDFSNWVREVIGDGKLATDLSRARNRTEAARLVTGRIAFLKGKI
ncbi:MAG: hypothetical protein PHR43_02440 [Dehalococcoidales bacterium]|nr:hypothetical protein [Dehalococcoidales bacterium]